MTTTNDNTEYDDFTIRIRFRIPANKLDIKETEIIAGTSSNGNQIKLKSADPELPIKESEWLILVSDGWKTGDDAAQNSEPLLDSLCRSLSFHNLSADFGRRTSGGGGFPRAILSRLEIEEGKKVLNDERGIMIFATVPKPSVVWIGDVPAYMSVKKEMWAETFQKSVDLSEMFTSRESMAFDLFTMAHKIRQSADAHFVLLFAAFETLLEPGERPQHVQDHVDKLIEETEKAKLPDNERDSLVGTLRWMRNYSIRKSGRQFVQTHLGDSQFGEIAAEDLFLKCYKLRNRLLHGQKPHPDRKEVGRIAAPLELMISKLLSGKLVEC